VLIETLVELGADVRWCSCNIFSTQDHAARRWRSGRTARRTSQGVAVFAWKGETLEEYWWCTEQALNWPDGNGPNMILDDGGDATLLVHKGVEFEKAGACPTRHHRQRRIQGRAQACCPHHQPINRSAGTRWPSIQGVSEETTTGVHRLYQMHERHAAVPAINVNDSVTKSKFDNLYGCRHSLVDGINRATDVMLAARSRWSAATATWARAAPGLRGQGAASCHRDRPDLRPAGVDGRLRGQALEDVIDMADIFVTATGNFNIITAEHMAQMKDNAIVCNIGHFDNEIDMAGLEKLRASSGSNIKPQVDQWVFPDGNASSCWPRAAC
jgi:adenosylhomocysteinase